LAEGRKPGIRNKVGDWVGKRGGGWERGGSKQGGRQRADRGGKG